MKLTAKELRKLIIQEMTAARPPSQGTDRQSGSIGPFEYKLADVISRAFEEHERAVGPMARADASWPQEVDRAAGDLEDALIDSGALMDILKLIDDISQRLHDGDYYPQRR